MFFVVKQNLFTESESRFYLLALVPFYTENNNCLIYIHAHVVAACDDGCTGLLLDKVDDIRRAFKEGAGHLVDGVIAPPWEELLDIERNVTELEESLCKWKNITETTLSKLPPDVHEELSKKAKQLLNKVSTGWSRSYYRFCNSVKNCIVIISCFYSFPSPRYEMSKKKFCKAVKKPKYVLIRIKLFL